MMNKRQYTKTRKALLQQQTEIVAQLTEADRTDGQSLALPGMSKSEISDRWNDLHDADWRIRNAIQELDGQYARRNWTAHDWNSATLIAANID